MSAISKNQQVSAEGCEDDIPQPIVNLNRWTLVIGIVGGLVLQQPLFATVLFLVLVPAVMYGQRGSLIFQLGKRLLPGTEKGTFGVDRRLMRFNNSIAVVLLGAAQVAFLFGAATLGWALALMVAVAASVALAGYCVGCTIYYRFRIYRYKLLVGR
jgi:cation transporter-like permease